MIGIIGAMSIEIETLLKKVQNLTQEQKGIRTFHLGTINAKPVVIVLAGIGKVNAAVTTSLLLENYPIETLINIGVAGGQNGVKHKDVVISSEVLYHDVDVTKFDTYVHGQVPGEEPTFIADKELLSKTKTILDTLHFDYKVGRICSGDQFVYSKDKIKEVNTLYNDIYGIEMEAGAIAHVATMYEVPFIIYRSISDILDDENQAHDFNTFVEEASNNASLVLQRLIEAL
jgi:adenosylhomocysteine nucleosidase